MMFSKKVRQFKAQVMLETVIAFVLLVVFFLGIISIWVWGNAQLVGRQQKYDKMRINAGKWGEVAQDPTQYNYKYKPLEEKYVISDDPFRK